MSISITDAVATGDRRTALVAIAAKLAADMDEAPSTVVAQIAGRLTAVLEELDSLPTAGKASSLDDLAQRRADRLATAQAAKPASGQVRQRRS